MEITSIHWTVQIGDPSPIGWFTTIAYLATAVLCIFAAAKAVQSSTGVSADRLFWLGASAMLFLLGINKQLDLQSLLTQAGRALAKTEGWYERRRLYQAGVVFFVAFLGVAGLAGLFWQFRAKWGPALGAILGFVVICAFVILRAASFNHVNVPIGTGSLGAKWNWVLELAGIGMIACAAFWECVSTRRQG